MERHPITFEQLTDWHDGRLDAEGRAQVEAHLTAGCTECQASLAWLRRFAAAARAPELPAPPEHLVKQVKSRFRPQKAPRRFALNWSWRWASMATTALVLILCASLAWMARTPLIAQQAQLSLTDGQAEWKSTSGDWQTAQDGLTLREGARLRINSGNARLALFDGSLLELQPGSEIALNALRISLWGAERKIALIQDSGKIHYTVQKPSARSPFRVQAPTAQISVQGTRFWVTILDGAQTEVALLEGQIRVKGALDSLILEPQEVIIAAAGAPLRRAPLPTATLAFLQPDPTPLVVERTATLTPTATRSPAATGTRAGTPTLTSTATASAFVATTTATLSATATSSTTPTASPAATAAASPTQTYTPSMTGSPTWTSTASTTPQTATATPSSFNTPLATATASASHSATFTHTVTRPPETATPQLPTATSPLAPSATYTPVPTATPRPTDTPRPTWTHSPTLAPTATATATEVLPLTPTHTPTSTPLPTWTKTATVTASATHTPQRRTITLQQGLDGYGSCRDVAISNWEPDRNFEGGTNDQIELRTNDNVAALLRFDLASIPPNAIITSATLSLYVYERFGTRAMTLGAYEVYRPWVAAEATWNQATAGQRWTAAGCNGIGSDRAADAAASATMNAIRVWYDLSLTNLIQKWVNAPASNFGLVLKAWGEPAGYTIITSEHGGAWMRPKLTISYLLPN